MSDSETIRPTVPVEGPGSWKPGTSPDPKPLTPAGEPSGSGRPVAPPTIEANSSVRRRRRDAQALPEPGDRIESFHLIESIGVGGMGAVYRAHDQRLDRQVALKLLPPEHASDMESVQRFYQEARAAARLDHENIARVYSIGHENNNHFIAFEFIEGTNIRQRVAQHGPLSVAETINYSLQIAGALVHAADRGVVHRDIKPSNLIVTPQGRAKLVDMGLARRFERGEPNDEGLTQTGMTLGTFDYISPEQARDPRDVDVRSDLYSLGCTMFHMLTGRPPFPEGTVLQKLLQHQEEPAPDVRATNPAVPGDLAVILLKLMAKDRDRRYQSPEQLVRDLLTVAGAQGLRSVSPEGLVWLSASGPPLWERHLIWAVPSLALLLVVGFLTWLGQQGGEDGQTVPLPAPFTSPLLTDVPNRPSVPAAKRPPTVAEPVGEAVTETKADASPPVAVARELRVGSGEDLGSKLREAPAGATVVLIDAGPYFLTPVAMDGDAHDDARPTILTIRAAPGVRPVLRAARNGQRNGLSSPRALLRFRGGQVVLEGLELTLESGGLGESLALLASDQADLRIRRCVFRRSGTSLGSEDLAAVRLRQSTVLREGERPAPIVIQECHFDTGSIAVATEGPVDLVVRDSTFGPATTNFDLDASRGAPRLALSHLSVMAGSGPVFRTRGGGAVVRLDDSLVAPSPRAGETTLLAAVDPDLIDWVGRGNLYSRIATYLQPTTGESATAPVRRFDAWSDDLTNIRETDSGLLAANPWLHEDPATLLGRADPSLAFQLDPAELTAPDTGARRGPYGAIEPFATVLAGGPTSAPRSEPVAPPAAPIASGPESEEPADPAPSPSATTESPGSGEETPVEPMTVTPMLPNPAEAEDPPSEPTETSSSPAIAADARPGASAATPLVPRADSSPKRDITTDQSEGEPGAIRTAQQLRAVFRSGVAPSDPIVIAAGAVIDLPSCALPGSGRWVLRGSGSGNIGRAQIRFRPQLDDGDGQMALFELGRAELQLENLDLVVPAGRTTEMTRRAAFAVSTGSVLTLDHCTVTVEGGRNEPVLISGRIDPEVEEGEAPFGGAPVKVRIADTLCRAGGDLIDLPAGLALDLRVTNTILASGGSLVHAEGGAAQSATGSIAIELTRTTVRAAGGLAYLESHPEAPSLPVASLEVNDSVLATNQLGNPLIRVDGQDALEALRDRVRWQGRNVTYHGLATYRRDQTSRPGSVPLRFEQADWEVAVAPRDEGAVHGKASFERSWDESRPTWELNREDLRLAHEAGSSERGPNLDRIPEAPESPNTP